MEVTHRVENSSHKTCGFMVNCEYKPYYSILDNADLFDNIEVTGQNKILLKGENGKAVSKKSVQMQLYHAICEKNPLVRDIRQDLRRWKEERNDFVLYLTGARQIGKTTELMKFACQNYEQIIYVNLAEAMAAGMFEATVLNDDCYLGMVRYCRRMKLEEFDNSRNTILVIDEIQESVAVYNGIRSLQAGLKCDIAVTGSYLGKTLNSQYFKPAGNVWRIEMLPLSFAEFCDAFGSRKTLLTMDIHGRDADETYGRVRVVFYRFQK